MSALRTVIFVDGQNFKKNLQAFSFQSNPRDRGYRLDEKHFDWRNFFKSVLSKFNVATGNDHRLIRAYWYNAESITPFRENPKLVYRIYNDVKSKFPNITEPAISELARRWWEGERDYFNKTRDDIFDSIQKETDFLEFKYVGQYVVKPFTVYNLEENPDGTLFYQGVREGEKGVDIGIAIDMVAKMNFYDVAILVSGDADFQPVVRYLKDHLRQVYQFSVAKGVPPHINYLSAYLKSMVDVFQYFDEEELLSNFLKRKSLPYAIQKVIDKRLAELIAQRT